MRGILFLFFSLVTGHVFAGMLETQLTPGGIFLGQAHPDSQVIFQQRQVRVSRGGQFILGFGRDAGLTQTFKVIAPDGTEKIHTLELKPRTYQEQRLTGIARKYVAPAREVMERIRAESRRVLEARGYDSNQEDFLKGFDWPVKGRISGVYGSRRVYNGKPGRPHFGLDVAVPVGTPVKAPASGVVRLAEDDLYYSGGTIIIDHGHGVSSSFLHLSEVTVKHGQEIRRGQVIGAVGATGRVTGPHLDWRYNWFDQRLDPALLTRDESPGIIRE